MSLKNCYNFEDFRKLAKKRLPAPIFHYIDGGADDETTLKRNTNSFDDCDLIPNILRSCLLYTSPSPRDLRRSRMPSSA